MRDGNPRIVFFCCSWGADAVADLDSASRSGAVPYSMVIRTMCSGRVDPSFILYAFAHGADAVMVTGCRPGDCHYERGNYQAWRRITLLQKVLPQLGIDPERLRLEWISPDEASKLQSVVSEFANRIIELGPVH